MSRVEKSPAFILGEMLRIKLGVEDQGRWPYSVSRMDDKKDEGIVFSDTEPVYGPRGHRSLNKVKRPGVQIRLRTKTYDVGYAKMMQLEAELNKLYREDVTVEGIGYKLQHVTTTSGIIPIGTDERNRTEFTLNLLLSIQRIN